MEYVSNQQNEPPCRVSVVLSEPSIEINHENRVATPNKEEQIPEKTPETTNDEMNGETKKDETNDKTKKDETNNNGLDSLKNPNSIGNESNCQEPIKNTPIETILQEWSPSLDEITYNETIVAKDVHSHVEETILPTNDNATVHQMEIEPTAPVIASCSGSNLQGTLPEQFEIFLKIDETALLDTIPSKYIVEPIYHKDSKPNELQHWGLPDALVQGYAKEGISHLYDWQVECLNHRGVLNGGNLVYSAPTGGGKTLVAEIIMLRNVLRTKKKHFLFCQKYFKRVYSKQRIKVKGFYNDKVSSLDRNCDIAVCTMEKVLSLFVFIQKKNIFLGGGKKANSIINKLVSAGELLKTIGVIVLDEMHMIGNSNRGYILELLLTKVRFVQDKHELMLQNDSYFSNKLYIQNDLFMFICFVDDICNKVQVFFYSKKKNVIVGLSATLPNLDIICKWLNATKFITTFRPVKLNEFVTIGSTIYTKNGTVCRKIKLRNNMTEAEDKYHLSVLTAEVVQKKHSCLVFCSSKRLCETVALHLSNVLPKACPFNPTIAYNASLLNKRDMLCKELAKTQFGLDSTLSKTIPHGIAFHHGGLTIDERSLIENAFRDGVLCVLTATSTLAAGKINFFLMHLCLYT
ncbi:hypothetical protein RFI_16367 [Reticulomyxa filosa]|uniref:Helicase ATP-binding domain-containing protein n=1 Tax=Reticulomyxa filosa TaxID=46433 RepID=X6N4K7_RETFI|nr:hypothetical protein RFI_16367 [Reticulomyxa filosa]|eukprot:ETO20843.1 hypothetical protein RFI_16367 [Reticulomyxa filosa]